MLPAPEISELASVAALVRELRRRFGLSQEKFAAKLGVIFSTVSRWERERVMLSPMAFDRMRELLEKMGEPPQAALCERGTDLLDRYFPSVRHLRSIAKTSQLKWRKPS